MIPELFTFSGTPFGWRVQLAALIKGVPLEISWLQPTKEVLKGPDFLALNRRGRVPVFRHGGFVVYESSAIVSYLDACHPEPSLFGPSVEAQSQTRQVVSEIDCYLARHIPAFAGVIFTGRAKELWSEVSAAAEAALAEFDHYEVTLASQPYVAVNQVSAADIALYPLVAGFRRAAGKPDAAALEIPARFPNRFPKIVEWMTRIETIPDFDSTVPPGWK